MSARIHLPREGERGSAAAELAIALPVVVLILLLGFGAVGAGMKQVALQDAAADAARLLGRGEDPGAAAAAVARADSAAQMDVSHADGLVCVVASGEAGFAGAAVLPLRASSCALDGGR
ncbi:hypothetical protein GCM10025768_08580 [Microbacterium pseudoresistens]|uniref:Flp pilus assembly protein TadG n=1 Tax=Microbacterium pseudoresistens TaxID=640634 RepID=A0A7Y9JPL1_9MICO|nr:Flp pilus assembly protein TadG [Microbacterium pseudoresistens]